MTILLFLAAIVPALLLMGYFHSRDAFPEPARLVWLTFALGIVCVVPVVLVVQFLYAAFPAPPDPWSNGLYRAFLGAAVPEELAKFTVLVLFCLRRSQFDEPMDGLVYGVTASLGFAALENVLYVADGGAEVAAVRALTAVPGHAMLGAIMGYYLGLNRFVPRPRYLILALGLPILLHGLYDFPLMVVDSAEGVDPSLGFLAFVVLAVEAALTLRLVRWLRSAQLAGRGNDYAYLTSPGTWASAGREVRSWLLVLIGGTVAIASLLFGTAMLFDALEEGGSILGTTLEAVVGGGFGMALFLAGIRLSRPKVDVGES